MCVGDDPFPICSTVRVTPGSILLIIKIKLSAYGILIRK